MPKLLLIFFAVFTFLSCSRREKNINPVPPTSNAKIASLIDDMAKDGQVDASITGIGGTKSLQYKRYEWMMQSASDKLLVQLTDHTSPAVRIYAYWALSDRRSEKLRDICIKHMNDTAQVLYRSGCVGSYERVNDFIR